MNCSSITAVLVLLCAHVVRVTPKTVDECFDYVNNTSNDPFDWMEDGSAVKDGEEVSVVCNAGYVQILGLTVRQFCELATGSVSVCMPPDMILVHLRTNTDDNRWGCLTAGFVLFGGTRLRYRPYSNCDDVKNSTSFSRVYDPVLNKTGIALDYEGSRYYLRKNNANRALVTLTTNLDLVQNEWYYQRPDTLVFNMADRLGSSQRLWYIDITSNVVRGGVSTGSIPSTRFFNVFFNAVINSTCDSDEACQDFSSDLVCDTSSGVGLCSCPNDEPFIDNVCQITTEAPQISEFQRAQQICRSGRPTSSTFRVRCTCWQCLINAFAVEQTCTFQPPECVTTTPPPTGTPPTWPPTTGTPPAPTTTTSTTTTSTTTVTPTTTPVTTIQTTTTPATVPPATGDELAQAIRRCQVRPQGNFRIGCSCWTCILNRFAQQVTCQYQPPECLPTTNPPTTTNK